MTISSQSRKAGPFTGNGSTTAFPFAFKVFQASDVYVVRANTAGAESVLTSGADYTVTLNANQNSNPGGTVTLTSALATNFKLVITSAVPNLQPVDITNNGGFYPKVINDALDRVTIMAQQIAQEASRGVKVPITSTLTGDQFTEQLFDARDEAVASASAAATSASSAASSAASASGSATTATTKASEASTSASGAASSASAAAGSATAAAGSATTAGNSATTATNKANEAASNATAAASSATAAAGSATTATNKAGEATTAAAAAAGSQTAAASSASSAGTSATNANNSATSASNSATSAASSASAASSSASSASMSASTATTKASEASTSATNAATSATNAASSATSASASATSATNSAAAAATSETNAASSASSAAASAAAAATALDNFDDRYLGPKSSNPTVDNDGNALVTGALYYRTTAPIGMKVWDGAQWLEASAAQQASLVTYEYVATAGQTTFSGADANGVTLSYTVGSALVSVNGVRLRPGDDFTATNGTSVVLVAAAAAGDEVLIDAFRTFEVANTYTQAQVDAGFLPKNNPNFTGSLQGAGRVFIGANNYHTAASGGYWASGDSNFNVGWYEDGGNMRFRTAGSNRMSIESLGRLMLNSGQLGFPATQNASSDANTLDDYEEGNWTPTIIGSTTNPVATGTIEGQYIKIGRKVWVSVRINTSFSSLGAGDVRIGNLPFAVQSSESSRGGGAVVYSSLFAGGSNPSSLFPYSNVLYLLVRSSSDARSTLVGVPAASSLVTGEFFAEATYLTAQ